MGAADYFRQALLQGQKSGQESLDSFSDSQDRLKQLLQGKQVDQANTEKSMRLKDLIQGQAQDRESEKAQQLFDANKGKGGGTVKIGDTSIGAKEFNPLAMTKQVEGQENKYATALKPFSDAHGAAAELEAATNRDGKGGIFTNPDAKLLSSGKLMSATPDVGIGLGELVGAVPKGTAEERKAIARYKLSLGHAMTGARMNPMMQKQISDSLGAMASDDPQLMSKGLRGSARILGGQIRTVGAGFNDQVRGTVHGRMGGDPNQFYGSIVSDAPAPGTSGLTVAAPQAPTAGAAPGAEDEAAEYARLKAKHGR